MIDAVGRLAATVLAADVAQRAHAQAGAGAAPEGAVFEMDSVIVATPLKQEARKARPVVAVEEFTRAQRLANLARTPQLDLQFERMPLDGGIDLNRSNLIAIRAHVRQMPWHEFSPKTPCHPPLRPASANTHRHTITPSTTPPEP
jgi:hypothetical protein